MSSFAYEAVKDFHDKFGVPVKTQPEVPPEDRARLRIALIEEEFTEFVTATHCKDVVEVADALADLIYVIYGSALEWGIPIDLVFHEVHRSNMSKVWSDGKVRLRGDGKVLKPPTYSPANVKKIIEEAQR